MTSALATMRVDYDQVKIKDLDMSNNPLLNKRRQRPGAGGADSGGDGDGAEEEVKHREVTFAAEQEKMFVWHWTSQSQPVIFVTSDPTHFFNHLCIASK